MNRDTVIGFVLIALVLIGFSWYNQPSAEQIEAQRKEDSIAAVMKENAEKKQKAEKAAKKAQAEAAAMGDSTALFFSALNGNNQEIVLKNGKVELTFDTKGGAISKAVIKDFEDKDNKMDVTLFDGQTQKMNFMLAGKSENIITQDMFFTPSNVSDSTVTMTAQAANGGNIVLDYRLGKDYMLHFTLQANGLGGLFAPNYKEMDIEWSDMARQQEKGFTFENRYSTLTYKEKGGGTDYLSETSEKIDEKIE
ncbi:MAG: membrane protein insertase YidC, partial [Prevotella sp.]|nr:membrane protein insertase YidC [Prevotella sp.]